ncbi:hypothetical protein J6590_004031 [Homalodisca vitripennis]|nr:hypothetical protein J6590_004031 [Homalodisca vitripennis]
MQAHRYTPFGGHQGLQDSSRNGTTGRTWNREHNEIDKYAKTSKGVIKSQQPEREKSIITNATDYSCYLSVPESCVRHG